MTTEIQMNANFLSLNVRGASNFKKRKIIHTWAKSKNSDLIFLQETHSTPKMENKWKNEWGGKVVFSHGKSNARGVCILMKKGLDIEIKKQLTDSSGRFIILKSLLQDEKITIVNVYAPNNVSKAIDFFKKLRLILKEEGVDSSSNLVIGGDFNCA